MAKTDERMAYEFLKFYHLDDQALVEGWRRNDDPRWKRAVLWFRSQRANAADTSLTRQEKP